MLKSFDKAIITSYLCGGEICVIKKHEKCVVYEIFRIPAFYRTWQLDCYERKFRYFSPKAKAFENKQNDKVKLKVNVDKWMKSPEAFIIL